MKLNIKSAFVAPIVCGLFATAAIAAVTFDSTTGTGFVGKGDVQLALNLNNAQLNTTAGGLNFTYEDSAEYDVPCKKENARQTLKKLFERKRNVNATIAFESRKNKQGGITGFSLTGFTGAPIVNEEGGCPGGWEADGAPVLVDGSATGGALKVNGVDITPAPVVVE